MRFELRKSNSRATRSVNCPARPGGVLKPSFGSFEESFLATLSRIPKGQFIELKWAIAAVHERSIGTDC
jgi:hypothetical protein